MSSNVQKALLTASIEGSKLVERVEVNEIELPVSQATGHHLHPSPVVGQIVDGEIAFQIEGHPETILKAVTRFSSQQI
jgi:quercetin dioxygenase-like cupin family protein